MPETKDGLSHDAQDKVIPENKCEGCPQEEKCQLDKGCAVEGVYDGKMNGALGTADHKLASEILEKLSQAVRPYLKGHNREVGYAAVALFSGWTETQLDERAKDAQSKLPDNATAEDKARAWCMTARTEASDILGLAIDAFRDSFATGMTNRTGRVEKETGIGKDAMLKVMDEVADAIKAQQAENIGEELGGLMSELKAALAKHGYKGNITAVTKPDGPVGTA